MPVRALYICGPGVSNGNLLLVGEREEGRRGAYAGEAEADETDEADLRPRMRVEPHDRR